MLGETIIAMERFGIIQLKQTFYTWIISGSRCIWKHDWRNFQRKLEFVSSEGNMMVTCLEHPTHPRVEGPKKDVQIATGKVNKGMQPFQIMRNHMGPVGFLNLHNMKMFAKHRPEKWFFMQFFNWRFKLRINTLRLRDRSYCWWFRNPAITSWGWLFIYHDLKGFIHPRWWSPDFWTIKSTTTPRWWNEFRRISTFSHVREF